MMYVLVLDVYCIHNRAAQNTLSILCSVVLYACEEDGFARRTSEVSIYLVLNIYCVLYKTTNKVLIDMFCIF